MKNFYSATPSQPQLYYYNLAAMNGNAPPTALPAASLSVAVNNNNYNNTTQAQLMTSYSPAYQVVPYQVYQRFYVPAYTPCLLQWRPVTVIDMNTALPFQRANANLQCIPYAISNQQGLLLSSATFQASQTPPERFTPRRHGGAYIGPIGRLKKNKIVQPTETPTPRENRAPLNENFKIDKNLAN